MNLIVLTPDHSTDAMTAIMLQSLPKPSIILINPLESFKSSITEHANHPQTDQDVGSKPLQNLRLLQFIHNVRDIKQRILVTWAWRHQLDHHILLPSMTDDHKIETGT